MENVQFEFTAMQNRYNRNMISTIIFKLLGINVYWLSLTHSEFKLRNLSFGTVRAYLVASHAMAAYHAHLFPSLTSHAV